MARTIHHLSGFLNLVAKASSYYLVLLAAYIIIGGGGAVIIWGHIMSGTIQMLATPMLN